jgi:hypothetical protein
MGMANGESAKATLERVEKLFSEGVKANSAEPTEAGLVAAVTAHRRGRTEELSTEELQGFRLSFEEKLSSGKNPYHIHEYIDDYEHYSTLSRTTGFLRCCQIRTNLQIFNDIFVPLERLVEEDDLDTLFEVDEFLKRNALDIPPIPERDIPDWLPEGHWWWHIPKRELWTQEMIDAQLQYDWYDGWESS